MIKRDQSRRDSRALTTPRHFGHGTAREKLTWSRHDTARDQSHGVLDTARHGTFLPLYAYK